MGESWGARSAKLLIWKGRTFEKVLSPAIGDSEIGFVSQARLWILLVGVSGLDVRLGDLTKGATDGHGFTRMEN